MDIFFTPDKLPLYVMAKPVGSLCNLDCTYCYYLEKEKMYPERAQKMSDALLERFIKTYIEAQPRPEVMFTWHGGEPLLRGMDFFKKALSYQSYYAKRKRIQVSNSLQTNGTLLNDEWCKFFAGNNFLIGISLDGPAHCHDVYRTNKAGYSTHAKVIEGINLLHKHRVEFNILSVINDYNVRYPLEVYQHFKDIGAQFIQFTPVVERLANNTSENELTLLSPADAKENVLSSWSVESRAYGEFLNTIFDDWVRKDVGQTYVINFDVTLANWIGAQPATCIHSETCGHAMAMEFNGDVYACDHFVFPEYKRGNIWRDSLLQMLYSPEQQKFGNDKRNTLPKQCKNCKFLFACNGECPKNRFLKTADGEDGLNYLCKGLTTYYQHVAPYMDFMSNELKNKRPPANVMKWAKEY